MKLVTFVRMQELNRSMIYGYAFVKDEEVEDWLIRVNTTGSMHYILNVLEVSEGFSAKVEHATLKAKATTSDIILSN